MSPWQSIHSEFSTDTPGITVFRDGHGISRTSDLIIYSVEAESINKVVAQFGPCKRCRHPVFYRARSLSPATKVGAIVAGQTSVKAPERIASEQHLPEDVHIVSCHSMHGPTVPTKGQPLVSDSLTPIRTRSLTSCLSLGPDQA